MVKIPSVGNVHSLSTAQVLNLPRVSSPGDRIEIYVFLGHRDAIAIMFRHQVWVQPQHPEKYLINIYLRTSLISKRCVGIKTGHNIFS